MARPVIVGTPTFAPPTNTSAGVSTRTITTPTGATIGEDLIAVITSQNQTPLDITPPSGWTRIGLAAVDSTDVRVLGFFRLRLTGSPATSYTFTNPVSTARIGGVMFRVQNAHLTQPLVASPSYGTLAGSTVTVPAVTVPANEGLYLVAANGQWTTPNATTIGTGPSGMTLILNQSIGLDSGSRTGLAVWQQDVDASTVASKTITWVNAPAAQSTSNGIVLGGSAPPPPPSQVVIAGTPTVQPATEIAGTTNALNIATPSGAAVGEALLAVLTSQVQNAADFTVPAGWTRIGLAHVDSATVRVLGFYLHHLTSTPAASYIFGSPNPSASRIGGIMVRLQNVAATQPSVAAADYGVLTGSTVTVPGVTVPADGGLMLVAGSGQFTVGNATTIATPPAGMTAIATMVSGLTTGSRTPLHLWSQAVNTGAVAAKSFVWTGTTTQATSNAIVIAAGAGPTTPTTGWPVKEVTGEGTWRDVGLHYYTGSTMKPVTYAVSLPQPQSTRVTLAHTDLDNPYYWAHRGGSGNWVEHTMRAYTNAVFHGAKSLEISLHRSLDGVWVMHHDPRTGRMCTPAGSPDVAIISTPWSTLSTYNQTSNSQPTEKVQRLDAYLTTYGHTHQTILEDKTYNTTNMIHLLDLIESYYGRTDAVERFIIKMYGVSTFSQSAPARDRGYRTWGYFYDTEAVTEMPTRASYFSTLGLNWDATTANWNAALAYNKPVIAHIIPSPAAAATAISKGARGLQCSNVLTVIPKLNDLPA